MNSLEDDGTTGVVNEKHYDDEEDECNVSYVILTHVVENIVPYISGFVGRKLRRSLKCEECSYIILFKK